MKESKYKLMYKNVLYFCMRSIFCIVMYENVYQIILRNINTYSPESGYIELEVPQRVLKGKL